MAPDDPLSLLILEISKSIGIPPVSASLLIPLLIVFGNRGARLIPDNATGPLKWLRILFMILGLHVKDNSGVPAVKTDDGKVIRQSVEAEIPGGEAHEEEQGVLLLDRELEIPRVFTDGARAIASKED